MRRQATEMRRALEAYRRWKAEPLIYENPSLVMAFRKAYNEALGKETDCFCGRRHVLHSFFIDLVPEP